MHHTLAVAEGQVPETRKKTMTFQEKDVGVLLLWHFQIRLQSMGKETFGGFILILLYIG